MIQYYIKRSAGEKLQQVSVPPHDHVWVHVTSMATNEYDSVIDRYRLSPSVVRDVKDIFELPRVEYRDGVLYVFLRTVRRTRRGAVESNPLLAIVKDSTYLTLSMVDYDLTEIVDRSADLLRGDSRALLLSTLVAVVDGYEELIHKTARYVNDTDQRLRTKEVDDRDFVHFVTIEDNLNDYHTNLVAINAAMVRLKENKHDIFDAEDCEAIEDIILHINQLLVSVASHIQSINSIRNAYSTIANNSLNRRMKTLTLLTVLIALPNVFYGMYGMNVALPFADEPWAYAAMVGFTVFVVIIAYIIVRRLKVF